MAQVRSCFESFVVRQLRGASPRDGLAEVDRIDFEFFDFFLTLETEVVTKARRRPSGASFQLLHTPGRAADLACGKRWCLILSELSESRQVPLAACSLERVREIETVDHVAALGRAILHRVFPNFAVGVLLFFVPRSAGSEIDSLRIGRPVKA